MPGGRGHMSTDSEGEASYWAPDSNGDRALLLLRQRYNEAVKALSSEAVHLLLFRSIVESVGETAAAGATLTFGADSLDPDRADVYDTSADARTPIEAVANTDDVLAFPYQPCQTRITAKPEKIDSLPGGGNHSQRFRRVQL